MALTSVFSKALFGSSWGAAKPPEMTAAAPTNVTARRSVPRFRIGLLLPLDGPPPDVPDRPKCCTS